MKLFVSDPDLLEKMFTPLLGKELRVVIGGKPETVQLLRAGQNTFGTPGFEIRGEKGVSFVEIDKVWEIRVP